MRLREVIVIAFVALIPMIKAEKGLEEVEKFIQEEIEKDNAHVKRSSIQVIPEVTSFHDSDGETGKPEKIAITILKDYEVPASGGEKEYVSVQDNGDGLKGRLNPPAPVVSEFISEQITGSPKRSSEQDFSILKAKDVTLQYPVPTPQFQQPQTQHVPRITQTFQTPAPLSVVPVPKPYKRKSMDGWIPLYGSSYIGPNKKGLTQQYKEFYARNPVSKGAYYSPHKEALLGQGSASVPQVTNPDFQIQKAVPQLSLFSQGEQVQDNKKNAEGDAKKVVIHAQNVVIKSDMDNVKANIPNISQIRAYGSTPQISALLRERFRKNQVSHPLNNKEFPSGGVSLKSLAQAIRNGAFSLENDIIPSSVSEKPQDQELEIMIPHRFKMRKPKIIQQLTQATAASITQPIAAYGAPNPPRINANIFATGLRDYGEGVKYASKDPIQIVETLPTGEYAGLSKGASLNQIALELEQKLKDLVQQEVLMQTLQLQQQQQQQYGVPSQPQQQQPEPQYGVPPPPQPQPQYGVPAAPVVEPPPQPEYGVPGEAAGEPLETYGPPGHEEGPAPSAPEYGPPPPGDDHHHHHGKPKKPFTLNLNFDSGFWGDPHAHVEVDTGDQLPEHHDHHHHHGEGWGSHPGEGWGSHPDYHQYYEQYHHIKEEVKEKLAHLSKNLFYSALDFSRKYNPITFIERVKQFPPIKFEVYDVPKGHKKGKKKGHGKKRRHH